MRCFLVCFTFVLLACVAVSDARAQGVPASEAPAEEIAKEITYEPLSLEFLSKLYWRLGTLDLEKDSDVDTFIQINYCDLYAAYFQNEFEWDGIRDSTREYIEQKRDSFPVRLEYMQPLKLGEYNVEDESFAVQDEYQVEWIRRFEVISSEGRDRLCGLKKRIEGYPRGMVIQFSRPFALTKFHVPSEIAQGYIAERQALYQKAFPDQNDRFLLLDYRDAYIVMKVRIFAAADEPIRRTQQGIDFAPVMGILEGIEIYEDQEREVLLYEKDMMRRKPVNASVNNRSVVE